ncbi:Uncharacterized protein SCG7109_AA_00320 [Chlamydiales bacterium SCGC AG-110-M15]|nr:Uncharacterized protein SCG7109_AA_00320 [Chlamydiales bacterium SCGC AG-110-M15]
MLTEAISVLHIEQMDDCHFTIEWTDGKTQTFLLADIQKACPCARCVSEETGERVLDVNTVNDHLTAKRIRSVGRYALRIDFMTGCSAGIYSFDMLRKIPCKS